MKITTDLRWLLPLLILGLGAIGAQTLTSAARRYHDGLTQQMGSSIAMYVAQKGPLLIADQPDQTRFALLTDQAKVIHPAAALYLLDARGQVIAGGEVRRDRGEPVQVDLQSVQAFLGDPTGGPHYGSDPARPNTRRVFSAFALLEQNQLQGYVYVLLGDAKSFKGQAINTFGLLPTALGAIAGIVLLASLLTAWAERRRSRALMATQVVQKLDEERRRLFESIGHDLRTPLTALSGCMDLLKQEVATAPRLALQQRIDMAVRHSQRLTRLVSQVFRLARIISPRLALRQEPVRLQDLASDLVARHNARSDGTVPKFKVAIETDAPIVTSDPELLETALENLLENALRHSGGALITLRVRRHPQGLQCSVEDDGCGLPADIISRLNTGNTQGAMPSGGLGLTIVDSALRRLGSRLELWNSKDSGTVLGFTLPLTSLQASP